MTGGKARNVNTGRFTNKGFELDASYSIGREWTITANYAYLHTDTHIVGAPKNKLFGEVAYTSGRWQFVVDAMSIWGLLTEVSKEDYALLGLKAAYTFGMSQPITLFVKGENLTATSYQINYGFPMPRATVMAGAELKF